MLLTALALAAAAPSAIVAPPPVAEVATAEPQHVRTAEVVGDLYLPTGSGRAPAILWLGGSEGGLAYFGSPGQPAELEAIPIETFTRAIDWLKARPAVAADRIGIVGTSKGAEAALLVASRRPDLKIAVLGVPSSVEWPGIGRAAIVGQSSWTEGGKPVPFTPYGWSDEWRGIHALYADGLADPAKAAIGAIPVERARSAIVMQSGYYPDPRRLAETLALAGLTDLADQRCGALSGGQARRVHYALAICGRPKLLVLDEPTAAMDRASARVLWGTVRALAKDGAAVLLTSHDLAEADALADRIVVMDAGRIVADDTPAALRSKGLSPGTVRNYLSARRLNWVRPTGSRPGEWRARTAGSDGSPLCAKTASAPPTSTGHPNEKGQPFK